MAAGNDAPSIVQDKICTDAEYLNKVVVTEKVTAKKMCSVEFYPKNLEKIEDFKKTLTATLKRERI